MKRIAFLIVLLVLIAGGLGLAWQRGAFKSVTGDGKVSVVASFYPMAEFSRQVGGDRVDVTTLVQPGVEPHDYEPSAKDLVTLEKAKVFVYNGAGLEKWAANASIDQRKNGGVAVEASAELDLRQSQDPDEVGTDPHVWMDPILAEAEVAKIRDGLIQADPAGKATYEANASAYLAKLAALDQSFRTGLSSCQLHDIVTSHQAFGYLSREYGLTQLGISGLSPDEEPSPQKLAEVAQFVRANNVHYIFFEDLVSPKLAQTIASETGAQTLPFNPLEGLTSDELAKGENYLSVQQDNLANLRIALNCN